MLKKNRLVSLIITFCFCFTFLAPAFIAPPVAEASAYYTSVKAPTIATKTSRQTVDLGSVQVNFPDKRVLPEFDVDDFKNNLKGVLNVAFSGLENNYGITIEEVYKKQLFTELGKRDFFEILDLNIKTINEECNLGLDPQAQAIVRATIEGAGLQAANNKNQWEYLTVNLPAGLEYSKNSLGDEVAGGNAYHITRLSKSNDLIVIGNKSSNTSWDFKIAYIDDKKSDPEAHFLLEFKNIIIDGAVGKIEATFHSPSSSAILPFGTATIANITGGGQTTSIAKSVKNISDEGGEIDTFLIVENVKGTFKAGDEVEIKLPTGFSWDNVTNTKVKGNWAFTGYGNKIALDAQTPLEAFKLYLKPTDPTNRTLVLLFTGKFMNSAILHTSGRVAIGTGGTGDYLRINVDNTASTGDVFATVTSPNIREFNDQDVLVAKYGKYESNLESKDVKQLVAGKDDQDIGAFYIKEDIPGSLISGRTIYLELPAGVKWYRLPNVKAEAGMNVLSDVTLVPNSNERKAKVVINGNTNANKVNPAKLLVERGKVYVEPGYKGDIEIDISGSAGVKGKAKVAEVALGVEMTTSTVPNVVVGQQAQKVADIEIKENQRGLIRTGKNIVLGLDEGYKFYKQPEVTVTAGNLQIDNVKLSSDSSELKIEVRGDSYEPSSIKIADIYLDGFRYATTGSVKAKLVAAEGKEPDVTGSTALDRPYGRKVASNGVLEDDVEVDGVAEEAKIKKDNRKYSGKSAGEVIVANCITPAGAAGINASFTIDSNIYIINGVSKVMDVAPYIKNERTYMPVRYVAYALGLTDDDIVWDEASQKVTLTKGDTVVEMTIGNKNLTINGEARSMDTAPEITNSRTMLPIRFVAEAFGAMVGWDPDTRTTVIN